MAHLMMMSVAQDYVTLNGKMKGMEGSGRSLFQHTNLAFTRSESGTSYVEVKLDKLQRGSILSQTVD
jgi:hypothetical protein